jgi:Zn-dependent peptidase ImmA (M78 family)
VHKFQTTSSTPQILSPQEIVEALLVEAGTANHPPTDETKLLGFLNLEQFSFDFMHDLDFLPEAQKRSLDLRAALSFNDRLVATQSGLSEKRKRFGIFHEIGHFILPEHRKKLYHVDNDATLSLWTRIQIEREANEIAAEILFQGNRFTEEALSSPTSVRTVTDLAPKFGASYESAMRRYAERHDLPCAVVVLDKVSRDSEEQEFDESEYKIHYTITSPSFRKKYFSALEIKGGTIKGSELCGKARWWGVDDIVEHRMTVGDWHFDTEIFSNGYKIFQFVLPPKAALKT